VRPTPPTPPAGYLVVRVLPGDTPKAVAWFEECLDACPHGLERLVSVYQQAAGRWGDWTPEEIAPRPPANTTGRAHGPRVGGRKVLDRADAPDLGDGVVANEVG
jgi:hypothetical protein